MKRFLLAFLGLFWLASVANAQVATWPPPAGAIAALCVYNTVVASPTASNPYFLQCDANGNLRVGLPIVLASPQAYAIGSSQSVGIDQFGGLIPATGLRTAAVTCSATCTTFGAGSNGVLFSIPTWPYTTIDVDVTSAGTGTTISYEGSNDNTNWSTVKGEAQNLLGSGPLQVSAVAGQFSFTPTTQFFRARVSAYGSGTVTAGAYQTNNSYTPHSQGVVGVNSNSVPAGAASAVSTASNPYPSGATAIQATASGTTGSITATLVGSATKFTYLCGFQLGAAAISGGDTVFTVSGTNSLSFVQDTGNIPVVGYTTQTFAPCIPSFTANLSISIVTIAPGTGGVSALSMWGYTL